MCSYQRVPPCLSGCTCYILLHTCASGLRAESTLSLIKHQGCASSWEIIVAGLSLEEPLPSGYSLWCVNIGWSGQQLSHVPRKGHLKNYDRLCWVLPARKKLKGKTSEPGCVLVSSLPRALGRIWLLGSSSTDWSTCLQAKFHLDPRGQTESPYWYWWPWWSYKLCTTKTEPGLMKGTTHSMNTLA